MSLVKLPEGAVRIQVEIDADALDALVKAEVDRRIGVYFESKKWMFEQHWRDVVKARADRFLAGVVGEPSLTPVEALVHNWLERREGWVAKMLRRKRLAEPLVTRE